MTDDDDDWLGTWNTTPMVDCSRVALSTFQDILLPSDVATLCRLTVLHQLISCIDAVSQISYCPLVRRLERPGSGLSLEILSDRDINDLNVFLRLLLVHTAILNLVNNIESLGSSTEYRMFLV